MEPAGVVHVDQSLGDIERTVRVYDDVGVVAVHVVLLALREDAMGRGGQEGHRENKCQQ